ncbi:MAG: saccharopine dehydrogenase NADP-binding domain-containing protein [Anaerolineaceae bacterium]|nr:MAG: saccharopine dehydrogenase NADP-binding domain-containing protein [Anaerolineaceae bacterium]
MNNKKLLILGGYGNTGRLIARLLLQETNAELILAGRSITKAEDLVRQLNGDFEGNRVTGIHSDASDAESLKQAFHGVDLVLVASSTAIYAECVAVAALEVGIDYMDIQYSTEKTSLLKSMTSEIEKSGRCFITDGGFHPGLPAALVHYVAQHYDKLEKALVGSVIKVNWAGLSVTESTAYEFMSELADYESLVYKKGKWQKARFQGMLDFITMDFGRGFGRQYAVPMFLEEMRSIPETYPSLSETGFYVGGFNWFVDWLVFPLAAILLKLFPRRAAKPTTRLMSWGLKTFSKPPYGTLLRVESAGTKDGRPITKDVTLYHEDGYMFTAIPVVACLLQYLDGSIRKPGFWTQANIVEPNRLMDDMERMGVDVTSQGQ